MLNNTLCNKNLYLKILLNLKQTLRKLIVFENSFFYFKALGLYFK